MIRAMAASLRFPPVLVTSAMVSRRVVALRVHAGPMSCSKFEMPMDGSDPSDEDILSATPGVNDDNDSNGKAGSIDSIFSIRCNCCSFCIVSASSGFFSNT